MFAVKVDIHKPGCCETARFFLDANGAESFQSESRYLIAFRCMYNPDTVHPIPTTLAVGRFGVMLT